jgi:hypothetical protein
MIDKMKPKTSNKNEFEFLIWTTLALVNWILDFGRPIAMVLKKIIK